MNMYGRQISRVALLLAAASFAATFGVAQMPQQQQPSQQPGQQQPGQQQPGNPSNPPQAAPLTMDSTPPPVSAEEEAAIKAFREFKPEDHAKKDQMAMDFLQKYPQSRYRPEVYFWLVVSYRDQNQTDKMEAMADKKLELTPNDPQTLAIVGTTLPRAMNASTPDPQKRLAKSEQYCKKALELLPAMQKPDNVAPEAFDAARNQTAAMAYSGLGLVALRRGNYPDAVTNMESAVKADPQFPDPVNYYVLGYANEKASHFSDAAAAFAKCASLQSSLQATCSQGAEEAKKLAATQLSAPK